MFLRKVFLVLFVTILGTSWFSGEGFVAAYPIVQYQAVPGYDPNGNPYGQPVYPNHQMQPIYPQPSYGDSRKNGPLIKGWDAAHDYGQNFWLAVTGQI